MDDGVRLTAGAHTKNSCRMCGHLMTPLARVDKAEWSTQNQMLFARGRKIAQESCAICVKLHDRMTVVNVHTVACTISMCALLFRRTVRTELDTLFASRFFVTGFVKASPRMSAVPSFFGDVEFLPQHTCMEPCVTHCNVSFSVQASPR